MLDTLIADRGSAKETAGAPHHPAAWGTVARLGSLKLGGPAISLWIQVRGQSRIEAREGQFRLARGEWLVLERDSTPLVQSHRTALMLCLIVAPDPWDALNARIDQPLLPGHGRLSRRDLRMAVRLWRQGAAATDAGGELRMRCLRTMTMHLAAMQDEADALFRRCTGRSHLRKRNVLGRMQRTRLYLEGNAHRIVRLSELAELVNLSTWHFSKTFHALYGESPQTAGLRMRLERSRRLLRETQLTISEVGAACGFDNCCSFSRMFRAHFDTTATRYRQQCTHAAWLAPVRGSVAA